MNDLVPPLSYINLHLCANNDYRRGTHSVRNRAISEVTIISIPQTGDVTEVPFHYGRDDRRSAL